jgi:hypothetical protein
MPVTNYKLTQLLLEKIEKRISSLIKDDIIGGALPGKTNYKIMYCIAIQFVPKFAKRPFSFGKPEGLRVIIRTSGSLVIALDFVFAKNGIKFSHVSHGFNIKQLVSTLKKLHKLYVDERKSRIELIQFFYHKNQFLLVRNDRKRIFYQVAKKKLTEVTLAELKFKITTLLDDPPQFENN